MLELNGREEKYEYRKINKQNPIMKLLKVEEKLFIILKGIFEILLPDSLMLFVM